MPHRFIKLEVCVASVLDAVAAENGGADRLELNMALELGGLTPTLGLLADVKQIVGIPIMAMVRPRAAGFRYSSAERLTMLRDAEQLLAHGANGVVAGALLADGTIDQQFWKDIRELAGDRELVFHRAFDTLSDQQLALQQLIDGGTTRVLTSGGSRSAEAGAASIARLVRLAAGRIEILPAAGIHADNVAALVRSTDCDQIHGSFQQPRQDPAGFVAEGSYPSTSETHVARVRAAIDAMRR